MYQKGKFFPCPLRHRRWLQHCSFRVASDHIKYLGLNIGKVASSLNSLNYAPLIMKLIFNNETDRGAGDMGRIASFTSWQVPFGENVVIRQTFLLNANNSFPVKS